MGVLLTPFACFTHLTTPGAASADCWEESRAPSLHGVLQPDNGAIMLHCKTERVGCVLDQSKAHLLDSEVRITNLIGVNTQPACQLRLLVWPCSVCTCVAVCVKMTVRTRGFPADHYPVMTSAMLFSLSLKGFNVQAWTVHEGRSGKCR